MTGEPKDSSPSVDTSDPFAGPAWHQDDDEFGDASRAASERKPSPHGSRVKVSRRRKRALRRRRRIGLGMLIVGGIILVAGIWILVTALLARGQLERARADLRAMRSQISAGDLPAARMTAAVIANHASRAHALTSGPVWAIAAGLPAGGQAFHTFRGLTKAADAVGHDVLPDLVRASNELDPSTLRAANGTVDISRIPRALPSLNEASARLATTRAAVRALSASTWLGGVNAAQHDLDRQLTGLAGTLHTTILAARIGPTMLGADGPRRYFVAFENDAEARGTGGLPGAFAIVTADHGRLKFTHFGTDLELKTARASVRFGPDYAQLYGGARTTTFYQNGNLSPNFPYAAQIWASMWHDHSGQRVDGVIALDPGALSYLLRVTGPATLPNGQAITWWNVVPLTQQVIYSAFPRRSQDSQRREYLLEIARAVSDKVLTSHSHTTALLKAAGRAAGERRLLLWAAAPKIQEQLATTPVAGQIPRTTKPYAGLSIVNDGGNKLDYYLDRSISWQRTGCGSTRDVTVTIKLHNGAPANLPPYVTARSDRRSYPVKPGDNRLEVAYFATQGAVMRSVTVDGAPGTAGIGAERGHPVYTVDLELPRAATRTIVLQLQEPGTPGPPRVLRQPLVRPLQVSVHDSECG